MQDCQNPIAPHLPLLSLLCSALAMEKGERVV
jgi:hypothetical protein